MQNDLFWTYQYLFIHNIWQLKAAWRWQNIQIQCYSSLSGLLSNYRTARGSHTATHATVRQWQSKWSWIRFTQKGKRIQFWSSVIFVKIFCSAEFASQLDLSAKQMHYMPFLTIPCNLLGLYVVLPWQMGTCMPKYYTQATPRLTTFALCFGKMKLKLNGKMKMKCCLVCYSVTLPNWRPATSGPWHTFIYFHTSFKQ